MKNRIALLTLALTLSASLTMADQKNAQRLDINKVLPTTAPALSSPVPPHSSSRLPRVYSPQQKARLVELKLSVN